MADRPSDIKYTTTHEWVRFEEDVATIGITDFAVEHLGDLVFVDLPDEGQTVEEGAPIAEVESVKAVGEIMAPVSGEVIAVNADLADDQGPMASDPYGAGWLVKIKMSGGGDELLDLAAYEERLASEATE